MDGTLEHSSLEAGGLEGVQAVMTVNRATDAEVFCASVTTVLGSTSAPADIAVRDHASAHLAGRMQWALARLGARLHYWPLLARCVADSSL